MASRNFTKLQALEKEVKVIYVIASIGASGAPTLDTTNSKGVASIARTAAGDYTITLEDKYQALMYADAQLQVAADEDLVIHIDSETVASTKTVKITCLAATTATDPSNGSKLRVMLHLKNTTV